jgi:predicted nucleotidyltransferase
MQGDPMDVQRLGEIASKYGIRLILQFGSSVSKKTHARSDLDLAVLLGRADVSWKELAEISHDLQMLEPQREVDLALIDRADPLFLKKITEHCTLLYGSTTALHELKIYAFKRYQDHRKYLGLERDYVRRKLSGE